MKRERSAVREIKTTVEGVTHYQYAFKAPQFEEEIFGVVSPNMMTARRSCFQKSMCARSPVLSPEIFGAQHLTPEEQAFYLARYEERKAVSQ